MDIEKAKLKIKEAESVIDEKKNLIRNEKQKIAEYLCPFQVGQRVLNKDGKEEVIACIKYQGYGKGYEFKIFKIKKNGEPYKEPNYAYCQDKYTAKPN